MQSDKYKSDLSYVQVLDDQKNWWKVRNINADVGYVPKTIIKLYSM